MTIILFLLSLFTVGVVITTVVQILKSQYENRPLSKDSKIQKKSYGYTYRGTYI